MIQSILLCALAVGFCVLFPSILMLLLIATWCLLEVFCWLWLWTWVIITWPFRRLFQ